MDLGLPEIRELVRILQEGGLTELAVEAGSVKVQLKRGGTVTLPNAVEMQSTVVAPQASPVPVAPAPAASDTQVVRSPMVGTFYRSPSPEAPPFVDEGSVVTPGQCLCIIEAMKLMNEIEAEQGGRIAKVLVANGDLVEYGQPLFELAR